MIDYIVHWMLFFLTRTTCASIYSKNMGSYLERSSTFSFTISLRHILKEWVKPIPRHREATAETIGPIACRSVSVLWQALKDCHWPLKFSTGTAQMSLR